MADDLESAKAIDATLADDLRAVGVRDLRELRAVGAGEAWERLLAADLRDALGDRLALEAAEHGRRVRALDPETRERCRAHVRHRLAPEPEGRTAPSPRFSVDPPTRVDPRARADRRLMLIALLAFALPIAAYVGAKLAG